jgi:peptidoglycan hydrolase CwlO-like protein
MKKKAPKKILTPKALAKKVVSDLPVHTNEEVKRYIGAVSENFGHQVSAVAEQYLSLNSKVDSLVGKVDSLTEVAGGMKEDIEVIKENIEILKSGVRVKVDYQDFEALERRVRLIETKVRR